MQVILRNEGDFSRIEDNVYNTTPSPDSYPCLAVGIWRNNPNGPDGYVYKFVYLIDESPDDINQEEKFSLDLSKL